MLKARHEAMDKEHQALIDSQQSALDTQIAQILEEQRKLYLDKEKIHDAERAFELEAHNKAEEEQLNQEKWKLQQSSDNIEDNKKRVKKMLEEQTLANLKRIEEDKKAADEKIKLDALAANKTLETKVAKDQLLAAQKAEELAKTGEEIAAAQMQADAAQKQIDQLQVDQKNIIDQKAAMEAEVLKQKEIAN